MLSPNVIEHVMQLYKRQNRYQPNETIGSQLADKNLVLLIGPTCAGKNTIMETAATLNDRFRVVGSFTSREPRLDDANYTYYENSDAGIRPVLQAIKERTIVQYAVNPFAHTIYGSHLEDYPGEYNMVDSLSSAVDQFRSLGFCRTLVFTVAAEPMAWLRRFEKRYPLGHPQRKARRDEAIESINWSLAEKSADHFWVENIDGNPEAAARTVVATATEDAKGDNSARLIAEDCLRAAQEIMV